VDAGVILGVMNSEEKENFIRQSASEHVPAINEKILWSLHAVKKLRVEGLRKTEVEKSLRDCIIVEDYPVKGRPLPDCLVLGFVGPDAVHSVVAIDRDFDRIFIVTVYRPSAGRWENDCKTRRKQS
jgi:hypothetical protein